MSDKAGRGSSRLPGFYRLSLPERLETLSGLRPLSTEEKYILRREGLTAELADQMVENVVGVFGLPLGVAANFRVNGRDYVVPMAVEESSVVAAASHVAKLIREHGDLSADADEPVMIGQIQVLDAPEPDKAVSAVAERAEELLKLANSQDETLARLGGGARRLSARRLDTAAGAMVIVHLEVDARDAMGANAVNTMAEALAPRIAELTGGRVSLRILTNLADRRLARARARLKVEAFSEEGRDGALVARDIVSAWAFADADPYRAATHNKGIMNGMDAVVVATGNDWRAVEAGCHAFAAREGRYKPLSRWRIDNGELVGELVVPMAVGMVGGATKSHPVARIALKLLGVESSRELAAVIAAVGLVQNLAALRSLVTEGIQKGHMALHARNVAMSAGAVGEVAVRIAAQMAREGRIRYDRAKDLLSLFVHRASEKAGDLADRLKRPPEQK